MHGHTTISRENCICSATDRPSPPRNFRGSSACLLVTDCARETLLVRLLN